MERGRPWGGNERRLRELQSPRGGRENSSRVATQRHVGNVSKQFSRFRVFFPASQACNARVARRRAPGLGECGLRFGNLDDGFEEERRFLNLLYRRTSALRSSQPLEAD